MANTLLTPSVIAKKAIANLYENLVVAQLMHRDYEPEFAAKIGDAITIRRPTVFEAKEFSQVSGIEIQNATETGVPMTLNHFADVSFAVTSRELTLDVTDFEEQFIAPAMMAMAQKIDRDCLSLLSDVSTSVGDAKAHILGEDYHGYRGSYPWSDSRVLIQAGNELDKRNVPQDRRYVLTGPTTRSRWVAEKVWRVPGDRASTIGLTEAQFGGRTSGFTPYMSQNIKWPESGEGTEVNVAFHETAFALAVRPLALPKGAKDAAIIDYNGIGLRVVYDYDHKYKQDVVSIDCLYGVATINPDRAVLIKDDTYDPEDLLVGEEDPEANGS